MREREMLLDQLRRVSAGGAIKICERKDKALEVYYRK
jgi:hypothetical protein